MFNFSNIRLLKPSDLSKLKEILDQIELFPSYMLEEMVKPFFQDPECEDIWCVCEHDGEAIALLYCVPEQLTESTWNMLALGVEPSSQRQGVGALLINHIEQVLSRLGPVTLLVETSSLPTHDGPRRLYDRLGYREEAVITDFWSKGDHKVIFWKSLG